MESPNGSDSRKACGQKGGLRPVETVARILYGLVIVGGTTAAVCEFLWGEPKEAMLPGLVAAAFVVFLVVRICRRIGQNHA